MAVRDREDKLGLGKLSVREKYDILTKTLYIRGKPVLNGPLAVRMADSVMIRAFGMLFNLGKKAANDEEEYRRLTGNFKRIGNIARRLKFLGHVNRFLLRMAMRMSVSTPIPTRRPRCCTGWERWASTCSTWSRPSRTRA